MSNIINYLNDKFENLDLVLAKDLHKYEPNNLACHWQDKGSFTFMNQDVLYSRTYGFGFACPKACHKIPVDHVKDLEVNRFTFIDENGFQHFEPKKRSEFYHLEDDREAHEAQIINGFSLCLDRLEDLIELHIKSGRTVSTYNENYDFHSINCN